MSARDETYYIWIDGASSGNPGPSASAAIIKSEDNVTIVDRGEYIGEATNNIAEYTALILALTEAAKLNLKKLFVQSDSELLIKQVRGEYKIKSPNIIPLISEAMRLKDKFEKVVFCHIPREKNKEADKLATDTLKSFTKKTPNPKNKTAKKPPLVQTETDIFEKSRILAAKIREIVQKLPSCPETEFIRGVALSIPAILTRAFACREYEDEIIKNLIIARAETLGIQEYIKLLQDTSKTPNSDDIKQLLKSYSNLQEYIEKMIKKISPDTAI